MKKDHILVTGGAGFIGSHLCEKLMSLGYKVTIVDNINNYYSPQYKYNNLKEIKYNANLLNISHPNIHIIDILDLEQLSKLFEQNQFDGVIHLAAYAGVRPSIENPLLYTNVNIDGTINILECLKKYKVNKLVFASSSSIYGNNKHVPFKETDFVDNPISPYAATKKSCELLCHTYHHLYNINIACLRFFTVYGPRQRPDLAIYKFTKSIFDNTEISLYGDGSTERDYTYITDIVDGISKALSWTSNTQNAFEIFNLGGAQTISLLKMVKTIEKTIGKKAKVNFLSMQPGDVNRTFADISKSKNILSYFPTMSFDRGIEYFIEWYRKERVTLNTY